MVGCSCRRAHAKHAPGDKMLVVVFGGMSIGVIVIIAMVAKKTDIYRGEEGENDGLDQADEKLHEIEHKEETGAVKKIFPAEDIAEETDGKGEGADNNGENLDEADNQEDQGQDGVKPAGGF